MDLLTVVSLLISGLALLVSFLSWRASNRSAVASERSAAAAERSAEEARALAGIEADRRHEERTPEWRITGEEVDAKYLIEFRLTVMGPGESYAVKVEVKPNSVVPGFRLDRNGNVSVGQADLGVLRRGEDAVFYGDGYPSLSTMRIVTHFEAPGGGRPWELYREFGVIWAPRATVL